MDTIENLLKLSELDRQKLLEALLFLKNGEANISSNDSTDKTGTDVKHSLNVSDKTPEKPVSKQKTLSNWIVRKKTLPSNCEKETTNSKETTLIVETGEASRNFESREVPSTLRDHQLPCSSSTSIEKSGESENVKKTDSCYDTMSKEKSKTSEWGRPSKVIDSELGKTFEAVSPDENKITVTNKNPIPGVSGVTSVTKRTSKDEESKKLCLVNASQKSSPMGTKANNKRAQFTSSKSVSQLNAVNVNPSEWSIEKAVQLLETNESASSNQKQLTINNTKITRMDMDELISPEKAKLDPTINKVKKKKLLNPEIDSDAVTSKHCEKTKVNRKASIKTTNKEKSSKKAKHSSSHKKLTENEYLSKKISEVQIELYSCQSVEKSETCTSADNSVVTGKVQEMMPDLLVNISNSSESEKHKEGITGKNTDVQTDFKNSVEFDEKMKTYYLKFCKLQRELATIGISMEEIFENPELTNSLKSISQNSVIKMNKCKSDSKIYFKAFI